MGDEVGVCKDTGLSAPRPAPPIASVTTTATTTRRANGTSRRRLTTRRGSGGTSGSQSSRYSTRRSSDWSSIQLECHAPPHLQGAGAAGRESDPSADRPLQHPGGVEARGTLVEWTTSQTTV